MVEIKALKCPNCGGSIPDTSKACNFCGSKVILSDDRNKFVLAGTLCPQCGTDNNVENRFCNKCGERLFKVCITCNAEIHFNSIHCPKCGKNIDEAINEKERELEFIKIEKEKAHAAIIEYSRQKEPLIKKLEILEKEYEPLKYQRDQLEMMNNYSNDVSSSLFVGILKILAFSLIITYFISVIFLTTNTNRDVIISMIFATSVLCISFLLLIIPRSAARIQKRNFEISSKAAEKKLNEIYVLKNNLVSIENEMRKLQHLTRC